MNANSSPTVTVTDGTTIAYERSGTGPTLIMVYGATQHRAVDSGRVERAARLAPNFTVIHYDRRGRGESTDARPYTVGRETVEREVEDLDALVDQFGGPALVWGHSSGAALALHAAVRLGEKVRGLALYEPPFNDGGAARQRWRAYRAQLDRALEAGDRGAAVQLFMRQVGLSEDELAGLSRSPGWARLEAVALTLGYDAAVMGEEAAVPRALAAQVRCPALVMDGGASPPFMTAAARALAAAIPRAAHRTLEGQTHHVAAAALAPVLTGFFLGGPGGHGRAAGVQG